MSSEMLKEFQILKENMLKETDDPNESILRMNLFLKLSIPEEMESLKRASEYALKVEKFNTDQIEVIKDLYELIETKKNFLAEFNSALDMIKKKMENIKEEEIL